MKATYLIASPELIKRVPRGELPSLKTVFITAEPEQCKGDEISLFAEARTVEVKEDIIEWVDFDHALNIHYTSGSTGRPKGIIHAASSDDSTIHYRKMGIGFERR